MLHEDALQWLNALRLHERLKLKHVPISITHELIDLGLARVRGGNLVVTNSGMNGSPRSKDFGARGRASLAAIHWAQHDLIVVLAEREFFNLGLRSTVSVLACQSAPNVDPLRRGLMLALATSELVGVAETARARMAS